MLRLSGLVRRGTAVRQPCVAVSPLGTGIDRRMAGAHACSRIAADIGRIRRACPRLHFVYDLDGNGRLLLGEWAVS